MTSEPDPVLFVESGVSGGGSFEILFQHLKVIDSARFRPVVAVFNPTRYVEAVRELGMTVHEIWDPQWSLRSPRLLRSLSMRSVAAVGRRAARWHVPALRAVHLPAVRALRSIIRRERIRLVHTMVNPGRDFLAVVAAAAEGVPVVCHLQDMGLDLFSKPEAEWLNRHVTLYVANSKATAARWIEKGLDREKIRLVYNATVLDEVKPVDVRSKFQLGVDAHPVVACVGRLVHGKGHAFLLRAFAELVQRRSKARLVLVGDGALRPSLESLCTELALSDHVVFAGYRDDARAIVAGSDIAVVPSENEPFGIVVIEALHAGTAVIGTNAGGIPEILEDRNTGLLVPYGDQSALAQRMEELATNRELMAKLVKHGLRTVETRFSIIAYRDCIAEISEYALGQAPAPRAGRLVSV